MTVSNCAVIETSAFLFVNYSKCCGDTSSTCLTIYGMTVTQSSALTASAFKAVNEVRRRSSTGGGMSCGDAVHKTFVLSEVGCEAQIIPRKRSNSPRSVYTHGRSVDVLSATPGSMLVFAPQWRQSRAEIQKILESSKAAHPLYTRYRDSGRGFERKRRSRIETSTSQKSILLGAGALQPAGLRVAL